MNATLLFQLPFPGLRGDAPDSGAAGGNLGFLVQDSCTPFGSLGFLVQDSCTPSHTLGIAVQDFCTPSRTLGIAVQDSCAPPRTLDIAVQDSCTPSRTLDIAVQDSCTGNGRQLPMGGESWAECRAVALAAPPSAAGRQAWLGALTFSILSGLPTGLAQPLSTHLSPP